MDKLDDHAIAHIANYFLVLSQPTRLKVLNALRSGDRNVGELADLLGCTTANISKHLSLLARSGLVKREAQGNAAYYRIADPAVFELCNTVCGRLGRELAAQAEMAEKFISVQEKG